MSTDPKDNAQQPAEPPADWNYHTGHAKDKPDADKDRTSLARTHEELYGCLVGMDLSLSNGSALVVCLFMLAGGIAVLGVCQGWLDGLLRTNLDVMRNVWACGLLIAAMLYLGLLANSLRRRRIYARRRPELLEAVRKSGLSHHAVVARIKQDMNLARIATRLGADGAFREDLERGPARRS